VSRRKAKSGKLSVFKGREARLNRAIFHTLALKGPQTIYDIHKEVKHQKGTRQMRYASINKRVRNLEEQGYLSKVGTRKTKAGSRALIYELDAKGYLAILINSLDLNKFLGLVDETTASTILGDILAATS